jgi:CBS domain
MASILAHKLSHAGDERLSRKRPAHAGRVVGQVLIALGVVPFAHGVGIGGLWLALIGWFLTSAAHAEEAQVDLVTTFEGLRVADAMTSHSSSFPMVDRHDRLQGLVTLRRLRQLPRSAWATTTVGAEAVPVDQLAVTSADELLVDVLQRAGAGDGRVLVVDGPQLVGIVTPTDVTTALERLALRRSLGGG